MTSPQETPPAMDRIELIQRSMSAFSFGLPGIVPFLGVPFAIVAFGHHSQIKRRIGTQWNPAERYLFWGAVCARIGTMLTVIFTLLIVTAILFEAFT